MSQSLTINCIFFCFILFYFTHFSFDSCLFCLFGIKMQNHTTNQYFFFPSIIIWVNFPKSCWRPNERFGRNVHTACIQHMKGWFWNFGFSIIHWTIEKSPEFLRYDFLFIRKHIFMRTIIHLHFIFFCVHISHVQLGICNTVSILNTIIFLYFINCCILSTFFSLHLGVSWIIFPGINFY